MPKPALPEAPKEQGNLSISHLPAEVQARILTRFEVANKAAAAFWDYVEKSAEQAAVLVLVY
jgi:hypothetical protein